MRYFDLLKEAEGDDNDRNLARLNFITDYLKRNPQTMNQLHKQLKQRERDEKVAAGDPDADDIKAKLETLKQSSHKLAEIIYKQQEGAQAGPEAAAGAEQAADQQNEATSDAEDADYEVVDEDN